MKTKRLHPHRRGTIYLMVMSTVVIVTALSLTGIALVRVQRRATELSIDITEARNAAISGIQLGAQAIEDDPNWRTRLAGSSGIVGSYKFGRATVAVSVGDPIDGTLNNSVGDPVVITSTATIGMVRQSYEQRLKPEGTPMTCLSAGITSAKQVTLSSAVLLGSDRLACNAGVTASNSRVWVPVEAASTIIGLTYNSTVKPLQPARQFPDATAFEYYISVGTKIPVESLSGRRLEKLVLSPSINPFGAANAQGIYVLDCVGQGIVIQNCRIVGTLVLLNCPSTTMVMGSVSWEAATAGLPALMVQGDITFQMTAANLSESAVGVNFNPVGAPSAGSTNSSTTDVYPSRIRGLVYVEGAAQTSGELTIEGVFILGGGLNASGTLSVTYDDQFRLSPPFGFQASKFLTPVQGSFTQVVSGAP